MTVLRCQISLPRENNIPADVAMNTWHFQTAIGQGPLDAAQAASSQLEDFYVACGGIFAAYLVGDVFLRIYDLQDAEPRVPIFEGDWTITTGTGSGLPAECAICLSYRGALQSGTSAARRRGRIFLGPCDEDAGVTTTADVLVTSTAQSTIANAAVAMANAGTGADGFWVTFSPTDAGPPPWTEAELEAAAVTVVAGFVDNAFDTVRSRGALATSRTTWAAT